MQDKGREEARKGEKGKKKGAHGQITLGRTEKGPTGTPPPSPLLRSRQFMQPLPQVNAASDTLRYADLKALLDSVCSPSFLLSRL